MSVKHAKLRPEEEIARLRIAVKDHERNVAQLKRENRWALENRFAVETLHRERRGALRWLLGVAPSYEERLSNLSPDDAACAPSTTSLRSSSEEG